MALGMVGLLQIAGRLTARARAASAIHQPVGASREIANQRGPDERCIVSFKECLLRTVAPSVIISVLYVGEASAACTPAAPADGASVSCTGVPILLPPNPNSFLSNANNLNVTVQAGAIVSTSPGGTALTLGGNGLTLNNLGAIDADAAGAQVRSGALAVGNLTAPGSGNVVINNQGSIQGTFDATYDLGGAAIVVANTGTTIIVNSNSIGIAALSGVDSADAVNAIAIGIYGGGNVNFTNTGTITGRVAFASPNSGGNTFVNAGTINGSVSLGTTLSNDTFVAVTGSSIGGPLVPLPPVTIPTPASTFLTYAATGTVDAGIGGADTLVLQNEIAGPGSGTGGSGLISASRYLNFENLTVNSGTWTLNGAVVSGSAVLNGGLANFDNALSFGTGTLTGNGGAIQASVAGLTLSQNVNLAGGLIVQGPNGLTLGGSINGAGGLIKNGTGTLTLAGNNNFSGGLALSGGGLTLGTANSLGTGIFLIGGPATLNTAFTGTLDNQVQLNGALILNGAGTLTLGGNIAGAGSLTLGSGSLVLAGNNSYSGGTVLQAGSIAVGNSGALGTGTLTVNGASSLTGAAGAALANNIVLNNTLNFGAGGGGALTLKGAISGAGGLSLAGAPGLTLNGANSFSGGFNLGGGALTVGNSLALGTGAVTVSGAGTLDANAGVSLANNFNLNAGLSIGGSNNLALNGAIGGLGSITKNGAAILTLGGANTFAGGLNLLGGGVTVGTSTSLGLGALTVNGAATFSANAGVNLGNAVVLNASLGVGGGSDISLGGLVSGGGGLSFNGSGTLALNGANTFAGGVSLASGTLSAGNNLALGSGGLSTSGNANLRAGVPGVALANSVDLGAGATLGLGGANSLALSGTISGAGRLAINSAGSITLGGSNSFGGGVELGAGNLLIATSTSLGSGALDVTGNASLASTGAVLDLGNAINLGAGASLTLGVAADLGLGGVIAGDGSLVKNGLATLVLTGVNTYTGGTTINAGTLQVGNGGTSGSIAGNILNNGTLVFDRDGSVDYDGTISGGGALLKEGEGTLTLSGINTFTGTTTIDGGTLRVNDALASAAVAVNNGGTLGGVGTIAGPVTVNNGGTLAAGNSPGTITLGTLTLDAGSISEFELNTPGVVGGTSNDLVHVTGNLTLGGTLNAEAASAGYYRLFNYGAALAGSFGTINAVGFSDAVVLTDVPGQVSLSVMNAGQQIQFWDGADMAGDGTVGGGSGIWTTTGTNWTGAPGHAAVNNQWQGSVAVFQGTAGTVAVQGTQSFDTLQFNTGGYRITGAPLAIGVGGDGIINANHVEAAIGSAIVDGAGTALSVVGGGTLDLGGINTFTGGLRVNNATVAATQDANLGAASGALTLDGGALRFGSSFDLATTRGIALGTGGGTIDTNGFATTIAQGIGGAGGLTKAGDGTLTLWGTSSYSGPTTVAGGMLLVHGSIASDTFVGSGGVLGGNGTIRGDVTNAGTLSPGASIGSLTVDGNYTGGGGTLLIEAVLGSDDSSADRVVITGNAGGHTIVTVVNTGGLGARTTGDGIEIVEVGGTSARDAFRLASPVQAGAFTYGLYLGGVANPNDQDWYLRTTDLRAATGVYPVLPSLMQDYGASLIGTMHQRMGEPDQAGASAGRSTSYFNGSWGRIIGQGGDRDPDGGAFYAYDLWGLQAGADVIGMEHGNGSRDRAGFYVAYGHASASVDNEDGGSAGDVSFDATSFGAYWTHFGANGWYVDAVLQGTRYQGQGSADGATIELDGWGIAASLEGGYPFALGGGWALEPQAQLIYQALDIDDVQDAASSVSFSDDESLRGRLGLRLVRDWALSSAPKPRKATFAFTADIWGEALGDNSTIFAALDGSNPETFHSDLGGAWAELGFEASAQVTGSLSLYGGGRYASGFDGGRQAWSGQAGLRIKW